MKNVLLILSSLFILLANAQETKKVLFLGNSYTNFNQLPVLIDNLAQAAGNDLVFDQNTPGGHQLWQHASNATTLAKINAEDWDYVVIQAQSQEPSFPPAQVAANTYPYADTLNQQIKSNNPCTEPMFYMTWGRKNGDASNCANYPPICTYEGMQQRLKESYMQMAADNDASVSPVGVAWKAVRDSFPNIELYNADESHPSLAGSYLAACVFYASIFRETALGNTFTSSLDSLTAYRLQDIGSKTVLDSSWVWRIGLNDQFITLPEDTAFCGDSLTIGISALYYSLEWSTGETSTSITVDSSGLYYATITNNRSCQDADSILVNLNTVSNDLVVYEACDSFEFESNWFFEDTTIVKTFTTGASCDSVYTVEINISNTPEIEVGSWQSFSNSAPSPILLYVYFVENDFDSTYIYCSAEDLGVSNQDTFLTEFCVFDGYFLAWNACGMDSVYYTDICMSIQELNNSWSLSPNPATDFLEISNEENQGFGYIIYNFLGQAVLGEEYQDLSYQNIPLDNLSKGNYFIMLTDKDGGSIGRKTIQKR